MHYQEGDAAQRKTIKVIQGKVIDFLYDLDKDETEMYLLTKDTPPLVVERNFAHGYLTIEPDTIFTYAVEGDYNPEFERSIVWKDIHEIKEVVMEWIIAYDELTISDKDRKGK